MENKTIPTAEEFAKKHHPMKTYPADWKMMIEFAKLHVEAALKAKGKAMTECSYDDSSYSTSELDAFTRNCYPLENIK